MPVPERSFFALNGFDAARYVSARFRELFWSLWSVNRKKIQRLWREEGMRVLQKRRTRQRLGSSKVPAERLRAEHKTNSGASPPSNSASPPKGDSSTTATTATTPTAVIALAYLTCGVIVIQLTIEPEAKRHIAPEKDAICRENAGGL